MVEVNLLGPKTTIKTIVDVIIPIHIDLGVSTASIITLMASSIATTVLCAQPVYKSMSVTFTDWKDGSEKNIDIWMWWCSPYDKQYFQQKDYIYH